MPRSWSYVILAMAILWLGAAQAPPANAPQPQRSFASPEEAVAAFVAALRDHKEADLRAILGPDADRVLDSGDKYADRELHQRFVALYDEKHAIDQKSPGRAELDVGPDDWPMPIPLGREQRALDLRHQGWRTDDRRPPYRTQRAVGDPYAARLLSMPSTIISISPSRQRAAASMPRAWSARPGVATVCTGRWPRARPKARWGR